MNKNYTASLLAIGLLFSTIVNAENTQVKTLSEKDLALQALHNMSEYLLSLNKFSIQAKLYVDEVHENGQKIQLTKNVDIHAELPKKIMATISDLNGSREFYYNGKDFTIYTPELGYYASVKTPSTRIGELISKMSGKYNVDLPLSDLFLWGTQYDSSNEIETAILVGVDKVNGLSCNHFAFRQKEVDWQVCIQRGVSPLPLKLVITSKLEDAQPQFVSILKWDTAPLLSNQSYTFTAQKNDKKISFANVRTNK